MHHSLQNTPSLLAFLSGVLPPQVTAPSGHGEITRDEVLNDVVTGLKKAPMATRLTPHILALIKWDEVYSDPIRRQFIPVGSSYQPDHPKLTLDSLNETHDSPVKGLVHRYPDKVLFLGKNIKPIS